MRPEGRQFNMPGVDLCIILTIRDQNLGLKSLQLSLTVQLALVIRGYGIWLFKDAKTANNEG